MTVLDQPLGDQMNASPSCRGHCGLHRARLDQSPVAGDVSWHRWLHCAIELGLPLALLGATMLVGGVERDAPRAAAPSALVAGHEEASNAGYTEPLAMARAIPIASYLHRGADAH
jgi:hypothetical protein